MAQTRQVTYNKPLVAFDRNQRLLGLLPPGVYKGFNNKNSNSGNNITIDHDGDAFRKTELIVTSETTNLGLVQTKQGVIVQEDTNITVSVDFGDLAQARYDILVCDHTFAEVAGGAIATYSVVKGALGAGIPALSNPTRQTPIGYFYLPAGNATDHSTTVWVRYDAPSLGGRGIKLKSTGEVKERALTYELNDLNTLTKTDLLYVTTPSNAPTGLSNGMVLIFNNGNNITQFAIAMSTGKAFVRSSVDGGTNWSAWQNLNNSDINLDVANLELAVGSSTGAPGLNYSSNNYIVDGEDLKVSIGKLDLQIGTNATNISNNTSNISNNTSSIGNLLYTQENYITDGDSLTLAVDKLDIQVKVNTDGLAGKANVAQEAWTNITLDRDWIGYSGGGLLRSGAQVRKSTLGNLHVSISIESPTLADYTAGAGFATLPVGYRPTYGFRVNVSGKKSGTIVLASPATGVMWFDDDTGATWVINEAVIVNFMVPMD